MPKGNDRKGKMLPQRGENWKQKYQQLQGQLGQGPPEQMVPPQPMNPQQHYRGQGPGGGRDTAAGRNPYAPNYQYGPPPNPIGSGMPYAPGYAGLGNYGGQGPGGRRDTRAGINPYAPGYSGPPLAGIGAPTKRNRGIVY